MNRTYYKIIIYVLFSLLATVAYARPIDDAKGLYNSGRYEEAITALKFIVNSEKKNGTANYYLGLCYLVTGRTSDAINPLEIAETKGVADASRQLAIIAFDKYDMSLASKHIDAWEKQLRIDKKSIPDELEEMRSRALLMRNMLERVEKIEIIDSLVVDKDKFFTHYRLSPGAGKLKDGSTLPDKYAEENPEVVFVPQNGTEEFWAMSIDGGPTQLVSASVLDDGLIENPQVYSSDLNEGGEANFPYLMSDGMTFYYANNGENSIGGYDIFISRRDSDGGTYQPQNIGMPYNSPFDDYMLVIDEEAGLGWWATDRNQIPGKITIYVFRPNDVRVNYDVNDPNIKDFAFIRSIKPTQTSDVDIESLLSNPALKPSSETESQEFMLSLGNGKIYTSLSNFKNKEAIQTMKQYLDRTKDLQEMERQLADLRTRYAKGDKSVSEQILSLEKRILSAQTMIKRLKNNVIQQETGK